jgi:hypothetical protein
VEKSCRANALKVPRMNAAAVLDVLASAAKSEPAKVVSRKVGISARHVRNIANGNTSPSVETGLAFAIHYEPVRRFFAEVLRLDPLDADLQREMSRAAQAWIEYHKGRR